MDKESKGFVNEKDLDGLLSGMNLEENDGSLLVKN